MRGGENEKPQDSIEANITITIQTKKVTLPSRLRPDVRTNEEREGEREREGVRLACTGRKNVGRVRQTNNERRQAWTETGNTRSRYLVVASLAVAPFHSRRPR